MKKDPIKKLTDKHKHLIHSEHQKVASHVQREVDDWILNIVTLEGVDVPFKYKRKKLYQSLKGQRVNITYYPETERIAGLEMEMMKVVRIKVS